MDEMSDSSDGEISSPEISVKLSSELSDSAALEKVQATTQLHERNVTTKIGGGITPPYPPTALAGIFELNETHAACIQKRARWECGFGFDLVPAGNKDAENEDPEEAANQDQYKTLHDFWFGSGSRWKIGPEGTAQATPEEVLELARQDYHSIGWACLEVLTNNEGTPVGLAWVPATTVRVRKKETEDDNDEIIRGHGYVQWKSGNTRYFGEAGDRYRGESTGTEQRPVDDEGPPVFVDYDTGDVANSADELPNGPANELIFLPNPTPLDLYYGIPDWIAGLRTIVADHAAREYNREFFEHNAIPHLAFVVRGGTLKPESRRELQEMLHNLRGEPHRTVILETEKFVSGAVSGGEFESIASDGVEIEIVPLGANNEEDMSFSRFREWNEHEIAKVHEVPKILLGRTGDSNRSNSQAQIEDFANDVVAPEQRKFANRLYEIIHKQAFQAPDWTIRFELRGVDNSLRDAETAQTRIEASNGTMTVNGVREELGLEPLEGDIGNVLIAQLVPGSIGVEGGNPDLLDDIGSGGGGGEEPGNSPDAGPGGDGSDNSGEETDDEVQQWRPTSLVLDEDDPEVADQFKQLRSQDG